MASHDASATKSDTTSGRPLPTGLANLSVLALILELIGLGGVTYFVVRFHNELNGVESNTVVKLVSKVVPVHVLQRIEGPLNWILLSLFLLILLLLGGMFFGIVRRVRPALIITALVAVGVNVYLLYGAGFNDLNPIVSKILGHFMGSLWSGFRVLMFIAATMMVVVAAWGVVDATKHD